MNDLITNFLDEYYVNPDPQYAVFLKGSWGCGKTYLIKEWLGRYQSNKKKEDEATAITLEPIYVSLYGLKTIDEIKASIDREINPFFYSKTGKFLKGLVNVLGKVVLKTSIDINHDGKDDATFSGSIDSLSVFHSKDGAISGNKFIVFDDLERCQIDIKTLLGFINYFVEHCGCHVVIVGDDTKICEEDQTTLKDFKEKTIGREFTILPDVDGAIDSFLAEPYMSDYLRIEKEYIIKCFHSTGGNNLRVLRQCLMDYSSQLKGVRIGNKRKPNLFLHGFLSSFIAVYAELSDLGNRDYLEDFANFYQIAVSNLDDFKGKALRKLNQKYYEVSLGNIYNVLSVEYVTKIVGHIKTGAPLNSYMQGNISLKRRELTSWEKLTRFWEMSNEEFNALYEDVRQALLKDSIPLPYQIGTTLGYLGYIDSEGVRAFEKNDVRKVKSNLKKRLNSCESLEALFQVRSSLIQGINYIKMNTSECKVLDSIVLSIQEAFDKKKTSLPDLMQEALRSLSDNNVGALSEIDDKGYPDHSSAYQLRAIFEHENGETLFRSISNLSNKGKNEFCLFLSKHYLFNANLQGMDDRYKADLPVLNVLKEKINNALESSMGVDRLAYNRLNTALDKALNRCNGFNGALE